MVSAGIYKSPVVFQLDSLAGAVWRRLGYVFVSFINLIIKLLLSILGQEIHKVKYNRIRSKKKTKYIVYFYSPRYIITAGSESPYVYFERVY